MAPLSLLISNGSFSADALNSPKFNKFIELKEKKRFLKGE